MYALATAQLRPVVHARLVEKDLCEQLGVSRTSLRDALRELEAEGVVAATQRGLIVTALTREEAANIHGVRAALEGLIAEQFAQRASEADLLALRRVVDALDRAYKANEFPAIIAEKDRFYKILCIGAKNPIDAFGARAAAVAHVQQAAKATLKLEDVFMT